MLKPVPKPVFADSFPRPDTIQVQVSTPLFLGRQLVLVWHKQEDDREDQELEDIDDTLDLESTLDSVKADAEAEEEVLAEN